MVSSSESADSKGGESEGMDGSDDTDPAAFRFFAVMEVKYITGRRGSKRGFKTVADSVKRVVNIIPDSCIFHRRSPILSVNGVSGIAGMKEISWGIHFKC